MQVRLLPLLGCLLSLPAYVAGGEKATTATSPRSVKPAMEVAAQVRPRPSQPEETKVDLPAEPPSAGLKPTTRAIRARQAEALKRFDKNQDGKLDDAELNEAERASAAERLRHQAQKELSKQKILERYDLNGDGWLNEDEEAMRLAETLEFLRRRNPAAAARLEQLHTEAQIKALAVQAEAERHAPVDPKPFDRNRNGQLDPAERAEYLRAEAERRQRLRASITAPSSGSR